MRINVVGTSGSGKSAFAKSIAQKYRVPYVQLDELHWKPNWEESSDEEFFPKVEKNDIKLSKIINDKRQDSVLVGFDSDDHYDNMWVD